MTISVAAWKQRDGGRDEGQNIPFEGMPAVTSLPSTRSYILEFVPLPTVPQPDDEVLAYGLFRYKTIT